MRMMDTVDVHELLEEDAKFVQAVVVPTFVIILIFGVFFYEIFKGFKNKTRYDCYLFERQRML